MDKIALFDLDGTLANYDQAMARDLASLASPGEPTYNFHDHPPQYLENRMDLIKLKPNWWLELEEFQLGFDVLKASITIGYNIHVLTQGPLTKPNAWEEKLQWSHQHVLPLCQEAGITITRDKSLVYGRVLVDDYPPFMLSWLKHRPRGLGIMPASEENRNFVHPQVVRYDGTNLNEVVRELRSAYERA